MTALARAKSCSAFCARLIFAVAFLLGFNRLQLLFKLLFNCALEPDVALIVLRLEGLDLIEVNLLFATVAGSLGRIKAQILAYLG